MAATGTKQQQPTATPVATAAAPAEVGGAESKESTLGRTSRQVAERVRRMEEEANRRKQEEEKKPAPAAKKDQDPRPKAPQAATPAAATPEKPAIGEKDKAAVDRESLEDRVRLCGDGEEVRAKAAATPTAMDAKAEHEKKAAAATCTAWKERIVGELKGLTDMKWADNTFEIARKNKEVVAVGVAAFSLGFFVSQRLFEVDDAAKSMPAKPTPPTEVDGAKKMPREEGAAKLTPQAEVDGAKKMSKEEGAVKPPPLTSHQLPSKDGGAGKKEKNGAKQPATRDDGGEKKEAVIGSEPKESTLGRTTRQVAEHVHRMEEAKRRKQIEHMPAPASKKEEESPARKAEVADGEKAKAEVDPESLAERVRRRGEAERAKAAAAATAMEAKTEQAKKAVASTCTAWKNRIAGELKGLTDMKWADNAVEMARRNKEVVAVGVAAFSIGFLVSQKLFRK
ncbi:hypothetical protein TRIUR3_08127 [Triticum urartu]|uniref:Uncharacterized protein n=1 Tax=Triticum urartu TaxID=4572 RepID=M8A649_TRIUA|nr:hypothetical protein TRIUR3_08127 [Triticum urartu]